MFIFLEIIPFQKYLPLSNRRQNIQVSSTDNNQYLINKDLDPSVYTRPYLTYHSIFVSRTTPLSAVKQIFLCSIAPVCPTQYFHDRVLSVSEYQCVVNLVGEVVWVS